MLIIFLVKGLAGVDNWADTMIIQYETGRKVLSGEKDRLEDNIKSLIGTKKLHEISLEDKSQIERDRYDKSQINAMIGDMSDVIEWLTTGREPGKIRGIDKNSIYQCNSIDNMDMFPSLDIKPQERELTEGEKRSVYNILRTLSPRERETFIFKHAYMWTFSQIADELGVAKSTAQSYYERAMKKIESCRTNAVQTVS